MKLVRRLEDIENKVIHFKVPEKLKSGTIVLSEPIDAVNDGKSCKIGQVSFNSSEGCPAIYTDTGTMVLYPTLDLRSKCKIIDLINSIRIC